MGLRLDPQPRNISFSSSLEDVKPAWTSIKELSRR